MGSTLPKETLYQGFAWEESYGFPQAVKVGDTIYVSGQIGCDDTGALPDLPTRDEQGAIVDYSALGPQMALAYQNAAGVLAGFGATLDDVVEEVLYVLNSPEAFAVGGEIRKAAYGRPDPQPSSTIIGTTGLAVPDALIEIKFIARVG